jgi:hypothetical protein
MSEMDDVDQDIEFVREKRKLIVSHLMENGKMPDDYKELSLLKEVLSDMDTTSMARKRIKVDVKLGNVQAQAAMLIAELFTRPDLKQLGAGGVRTVEVILPDNPTEITFAPGEKDDFPVQEDYEAFMSRTRGN